MKKLLIALCSVCLLSAVDWQEDLSEAQRQEKPLLLFFTGSDWCGACMHLKETVLDTPEFEKALSSDLVFVELDHPLKKQQPKWLQEQNQALEERFGVMEYPTIVLVESDGEKIGVVDRRGGVDGFVSSVKGLLGQARRFDRQLGTLDQLSEADLTALYEQALSLDRPEQAAQICEQGRKIEEGSFFLEEAYRRLRLEHGAEADAVIALEDELLELGFAQHRLIAILDFQELLGADDVGAHEVVEPLVDYLEEMGAQDPEKWRVEMTIAQYLASEGQLSDAAEYGQASLAAAPKSQKEQIRSFLRRLETK